MSIRFLYDPVMIDPYLIAAFAALLCLFAGSIAALRKAERTLNLLLLAAIAGTGVVIALQFHGVWDTGFAGAIWVSILATLLLFFVLAVLNRDASALSVLLMPYLAVLGALAMVFPASGEAVLTQSLPKGWVWAHIAFSVVTYGLLTLTAVAGVSAMIRERTLKSKVEGRYASVLPTLARSEALETTLLHTSLLVLTLGIATGMSVQFFHSGSVLNPDHKTIFALSALAVVAGLAAARQFVGLRGRRGARVAMIAWLLVTLAYPGVKLATVFIGVDS